MRGEWLMTMIMTIRMSERKDYDDIPEHVNGCFSALPARPGN